MMIFLEGNKSCLLVLLVEKQNLLKTIMKKRFIKELLIIENFERSLIILLLVIIKEIKYRKKSYLIKLKLKNYLYICLVLFLANFKYKF